MKRSFWVKRFLIAMCIAFTVIAACHLLRGRSWTYATSEALVWSFITGWVYTLALRRNIRKGGDCALCPAPSVHENH